MKTHILIIKVTDKLFKEIRPDIAIVPIAEELIEDENWEPIHKALKEIKDV